jgi:hypothetical protein
MGLLIGIAVIAPLVGAAAALDWRSRKRRRRHGPSQVRHHGPSREIETGMDIGDIGG